MDCVFCKIISGDMPNHTVYEDDKTLAFLDIYPHAKGHTVVIHKEHGELAADLSNQSFLEVMQSVKKTMAKLKDVLNPEGFNVGFNDGEAAGQTVPHLHVHILPRYSDDGGGSIHSIVNKPGDQSVEEIAKLFL